MVRKDHISKKQARASEKLDLKGLLYDAYQRGRLHVVLPFVAKFLQAKTRSCFDLRILDHGIDELTSRDIRYSRSEDVLKFELEVLCKALEVEINTLSSPNILITLEDPRRKMLIF